MSIVRVQSSYKKVKKKIKDRFNKVKVKMKTKKSLLRRFKITGTGKLMRTRAGHRHNLRKRGKRFKRLSPMCVANKSVTKMVMKMVPYKKYIR